MESIYKILQNFFSAFSNRKRILVFGDSNSSRPNRALSWPALAKVKLKRSFIIVNESMDGRTICYDRGDLNGLFYLQKKIKSFDSFDFFVLMLGTNDVKMCYGPPEINNTMVKFSGLLDTVRTHSSSAIPVVILPPPIGNSDMPDFYGAELRIRELFTAIEKFCFDHAIHLIDLPSIIDMETHLEPDSVHLNSSGREKLADFFSRYFLLNFPS